ncbi:MAG: hypothetical protein GXP55_06020 [Deltaproteobacteria bacterium]|nr:hypothetical protein [Deltaproteobacteria bacterium]
MSPSISSLSLLACLALGCAAGSPSGFRDAASPPMDSGVTDSGLLDSAVDAGVTDSGLLDSGVADSGLLDSGLLDSGATDSGTDSGTRDSGLDSGADAGTPSVSVDGTVTDAEWAGAAVARNTSDTDWGPGLNHLEVLRLAVVGPDLFLAIEGAMEPTNAIVAFVDVKLGAAGGVSDLGTLTDTTGNLDNAVSATLVASPTFKADYAFGTRVMSHAGSGFDDAFGWRDIASDTTNFAWVDSAVAPGVCSAGACETRIPLASLGAVSGDTIGVFVRLGNAMGNDFSNQTLPQDVPATPMVVSRWLEVSVP